MAELIFFSGTMDCGKSALALQMDHNHRARNRGGVLFSCKDRAGTAAISSRLGLQTAAVEVTGSTDFRAEVVDRRTRGERVDYLICDEAQFYSPEHVEQLAGLVDEMDVDVFAFGITTDFKTQLFPGSQRLIELADRVQVLQVEALCWCGKRATHNARTIDGVMVVEGDQMVIGNVGDDDMATTDDDPRQEVLSGGGLDSLLETTPAVGYETLCRRHYMRRTTTHRANIMAEADQLLPFEPKY
ncbi:thymidine kinase [Arthrobacter sp. H14]|uniref:thymidine kinase n=1 Tax=Arthrobacter sp. H14 TaxID=1312959 RepID=UPI0004BBC447|nr:thymidine kinase [Arthrobacter sp. H14]